MSEESVEQLRDERSDLLVQISLLEGQGLAQTDDCFAARKRLQLVDARLKAWRLSMSGDSYKPRRRIPPASANELGSTTPRLSETDVGA
jgi:hypothetical protein